MTFKAYDIVSHPVYGDGIVTQTVKPDECVASVTWDDTKLQASRPCRPCHNRNLFTAKRNRLR